MWLHGGHESHGTGSVGRQDGRSVFIRETNGLAVYVSNGILTFLIFVVNENYVGALDRRLNLIAVEGKGFQIWNAIRARSVG